MDHKEKLTELHKETLQKVEELVKAKGELKQDDHDQIHSAKEEWNNAWNKMMEVLLVLERLEI